MSKLPGPDLGTFLREQRQNAKLSLRQLSELAGVSNPYLSQIERGLKRPSAEILQQLAHGLEVSAETLYIRAGILDEAPAPTHTGPDVLAAIASDPALSDRQRAVLVDVYESFVAPAAPTTEAPTTEAPKAAKAPKAPKAPGAPKPPKTAPKTPARSAATHPQHDHKEN
ncbi:MAG: helix-turn-helix transcriptional regulator [Lapillicoccus sp.]